MFPRKIIIVVLLALFFYESNTVQAQTPANKSLLAEAEKILAASAYTILNGEDTEDRLRADSFFH